VQARFCTSPAGFGESRSVC